MANKQVLREFQSHLAGRLQAAKTNEEPPAAWLAVEAGTQKYLLPLGQSAEIFPCGALQPVPYTQPWFTGVANLRGGLYGVIDLASFISGQLPLLRTDAALAACRLVTLSQDFEINCALLVDRLAGLRKLDEFHAAPRALSKEPSFFGSAYVDLSGQTWQEIDLQLLVQESHFLAIGV